MHSSLREWRHLSLTVRPCRSITSRALEVIMQMFREVTNDRTKSQDPLQSEAFKFCIYKRQTLIH